MAIYLKGAAFFILPVFFGLLSLWVLIRQEKPNLLLMTLLGALAIFLFAPHIQFFPVGLGLKMLVASTIFTVLLFGLLLPVFGFYKMKRGLSVLFYLLAIFFFVKAHLSSDFSPERQKPNSLIYYQDADNGNTYWTTYDKMGDDWTAGYLGKNPEEASKFITKASGSKYGRGYTFATEAPKKEIPLFKTELKQDTIINGNKNVTFTIIPQRNVNQISLYAGEGVRFKTISFNGKSLETAKVIDSSTLKIKGGELVRYYMSDKDSLEVSYTISKEQPVTFTVMEYSYDLLSHPKFSINKRAENMMPKPFVVTDAIVVKKTIDIDALQSMVNDIKVQSSLKNI